MLTVELRERDLYIALRTLILSLIPGVEVVQGLGNGVPMPASGFICMTILFKNRLSTNTHQYDEDIYSIGQSWEITLQVDCYGKDADQWSDIITTVLRDDYGFTRFPEGIKPLYCDDPQLIPLVNAEQQYEKRWMTTAHIQFNQSVSRPNENI